MYLAMLLSYYVSKLVLFNSIGKRNFHFNLNLTPDCFVLNYKLFGISLNYAGTLGKFRFIWFLVYWF